MWYDGIVNAAAIVFLRLPNPFLFLFCFQWGSHEKCPFGLDATKPKFTLSPTNRIEDFGNEAQLRQNLKELAVECGIVRHVSCLRCLVLALQVVWAQGAFILSVR